MKPASLPPAALDGLLQLAASLTTGGKLDLIARLPVSVEAELAQTSRENSFAGALGAFEPSQTAEELVADLRASRTFTRQIQIEAF